MNFQKIMLKMKKIKIWPQKSKKSPPKWPQIQNNGEIRLDIIFSVLGPHKYWHSDMETIFVVVLKFQKFNFKKLKKIKNGPKMQKTDFFIFDPF